LTMSTAEPLSTSRGRDARHRSVTVASNAPRPWGLPTTRCERRLPLAKENQLMLTAGAVLSAPLLLVPSDAIRKHPQFCVVTNRQSAPSCARLRPRAVEFGTEATSLEAAALIVRSFWGGERTHGALRAGHHRPVKHPRPSDSLPRRPGQGRAASAAAPMAGYICLRQC
jgi:hypothetical protein